MSKAMIEEAGAENKYQIVDWSANHLDMMNRIKAITVNRGMVVRSCLDQVVQLMCVRPVTEPRYVREQILTGNVVFVNFSQVVV